MDSLPSLKPDILQQQSEASSAITLLKSGLSCFQQGQYAEGIAFFTLAREQLSPNLIQLTAELNALLQDYIGYCQAQHMLQQASECLVQAHTKQQSHATCLAKLLAELSGDLSPVITTNSTENHHAAQYTLVHETQQVPEREQEASSLPLPALYFTCFGSFEVKRSGKTIPLCANRNGQAILRYIVAQPGHRATMDMLMELLWPEEEPKVAHHKLQVALSAVRRSLNDGLTDMTGGGYILCKT